MMEPVRSSLRGYALTDIGQVHFRRTRVRDSGPALLLLHDSPLSSAIFEEILVALERRGVNAVAFDLPGYGLSDAPAEQPRVEEYARWLLAAASGVGLDSFIAVGAHGGSLVATEMASQAPERIRKIVVSGLPLVDSAETKRFMEDHWTLRTVEPDLDGSHLVATWEHYRTWWGPETDPELLHLAAVSILSNHRRYMWMITSHTSYDVEAKLKELTVPVILFTAKRDYLARTDARAVALRPDICEVWEAPDATGQLWYRAREPYLDMLLNVAGTEHSLAHGTAN